MKRAQVARWKAYAYLIALMVGATLLLTVWPYPKISVTGEATLTSSYNVPRGGQVSFVREEVCYPPGRTKVVRLAVQVDEVRPNVRFEFPLDDFWIVNNGDEFCLSPNETVITLPATLAPGKWIIEITTDTENPSYIVAGTTSYSPEFRVVEDSGSPRPLPSSTPTPTKTSPGGEPQ